MEIFSSRELEEDLEAQRDILAVIQAEQMDRFKQPGEDGISILDKVRHRLGVGPDTPIGQPKAAVRKQKVDESGDTSTVYCVVVDPIGLNETGFQKPNKPIRLQVPVAEEYQGVVVSRGRFNNTEAEAVIAMINGLDESYDLGLLPNLSPDCTFIRSTSKSIANAPKE